ncbi:hypothetical protein pb186bvf_003652 [Paramecium bursaria]
MNNQQNPLNDEQLQELQAKQNKIIDQQNRSKPDHYIIIVEDTQLLKSTQYSVYERINSSLKQLQLMKIFSDFRSNLKKS